MASKARDALEFAFEFLAGIEMETDAQNLDRENVLYAIQDALDEPDDPIASAVRAELQPLEDALIEAGHQLAKDGELRRKPFRLDVSKEWCERMAQLEEGHDVCAGGEPLPDAKDGDA